jgi:hypothetical protein
MSMVCEISGGPWDGKVFIIPDNVPPPIYRFPMPPNVRVMDPGILNENMPPMRFAVCKLAGQHMDNARAVYLWEGIREGF